MSPREKLAASAKKAANRALLGLSAKKSRRETKDSMTSNRYVTFLQHDLSAFENV
jgi:hypothetical protein